MCWRLIRCHANAELRLLELHLLFARALDTAKLTSGCRWGDGATFRVQR
jgi:hypothetical protein